MREQYGVLFPRFWEGTTGRQLQEKGRDAVILAAYLASCRHANMIGLYELPLVFLERELSVLRSRAHILKAFHALQEVSYATYDMGTEHVWVREMARIRLGLEPAETINQGDNKHKAVVKLYVSAKSNPFLAPFFDRYHATLRLAESGRHFNRLFTACKGLRRGLVAARKGLVSQYRYKYINQYKFKDQVPRNINKKKLRLRRRSRPLSTRTLMRTWKSSRRSSRRT